MNEVSAKMLKAVEVLESSLVGIRSSAITSSCVDVIKVRCYGQPTPIKHIATTVDRSNQVVITPYDPSLSGEILKSLTDVGFNAYTFSKSSIVVSANALSGSEREKVKSQIRKMGEEAKVAIRNIRKAERSKLDLPEDEKRKEEANIQEMTSKYENKVDGIIKFKLESLG